MVTILFLTTINLHKWSFFEVKMTKLVKFTLQFYLLSCFVYVQIYYLVCVIFCDYIIMSGCIIEINFCI